MDLWAPLALPFFFWSMSGSTSVGCMSSESLVQGRRAAQWESFRVMVGLVWVSVSTLPFVSSSVKHHPIHRPGERRDHSVSRA